VTERTTWCASPPTLVRGGSDVKVQVPVQTSVRVKTLTGKEVHIENVNGKSRWRNMNGQVTVLTFPARWWPIRRTADHRFAEQRGDRQTDELFDHERRYRRDAARGDEGEPPDEDREWQYLHRLRHAGRFHGAPTEGNGQSRQGRTFLLRTDRSTRATINGGGPEIQFTSFQGNILIHKK